MKKQSFTFRFITQGFIAIVAIIGSLVALICAICTTVDYQVNYACSTATVHEIIKNEDEEPILEIIKYYANEVEYKKESESFNINDQAGDEITIYYKKDDPNLFKYSYRNLEIYLYTFGTTFLALGISGIIITVKKIKTIDGINRNIELIKQKNK